MEVIDARQIAACAPPEALVEAVADLLRTGCEAPLRHHHTLSVPGAEDATLLLMPAWQAGRYVGVKLATVFPGNAVAGLPAVAASYLLHDARNGRPLALIDGGELTARRTAAVSALAARHLLRLGARRMLMIGTGRMARHLVRTHRALAPGLDDVRIWGRSPARVEALVGELAAEGVPVAAAGPLEVEVARADLISCATLSHAPLVCGDWVRPGTHVDLVGGFTPAMREADDALMGRAQVFVDTWAGAKSEAGDIVVPLERGIISADAVAELAELCRGSRSGRTDSASITVFKSVGAAIEDLAAAILIYERRVASHAPSGEIQP
jgi:alanine dehydrogenase